MEQNEIVERLHAIMDPKNSSDAGDIISRKAPAIRAALGDPRFDVAAAVAAGEMRLSNFEHVSGFRTILEGKRGGHPTYIMISRRLWLRRLSFREELQRMEAEAASGNGAFHQLLAGRLAASIELAFSERKLAPMKTGVQFGRQMIGRPYMGRVIEMEPAISARFHHVVMQHILSGCIDSQVDAVFDIGCGSGAMIAELASRDRSDRTRYFGGDISLAAHGCVLRFSKALGSDRLHAVDFDIARPDFSFLRGFKKILVFSHFALTYANPFPQDFWPQLLGAAEEVHAALFEPISYCLPELAPTPLFSAKMAVQYGVNDQFFKSLRQLERDRRIEFQEIVPDLTGLSLFAPVSLIRFKNAGG